MQKLITIGMVLAAMTGPTVAMTLQEAKDECRAIYGGSAGNLAAQRTGKTQMESIRECVMEKMKKK